MTDIGQTISGTLGKIGIVPIIVIVLIFFVYYFREPLGQFLEGLHG